MAKTSTQKKCDDRISILIRVAVGCCEICLKPGRPKRDGREINGLHVHHLISRAVQQFRYHPYNLVVLDIVMPDMGGGEVYDRLKEINPEVKVLLSSGYSIDDQAREIMERGCDGFIQKPFSMKAMSDKLSEILSKGGGSQ